MRPLTQTNVLGVAVLALLVFLGAMPVAAQAQTKDPVFDSTVYLMRTGMTLDRRGQFSTMLRSMRQLNDPALAPYFRELLLSDNRVMQIHGILGLAEIDPNRQLDLKLMADVKDPVVQSELVGAALDSDLINVASSKQMLAWPAMEFDAKMVIATHLLAKNEFNDIAMLKQAAETTNNARKGIIAMMLTQLGDPMGPAMLAELDRSTEKTRDAVRTLVLQTAFRFKFERLTGWALKLAKEPGISETLGLLALRTALRFGEKEAYAIWTQQFNSTTDAADRMRLAVSLLNLSQYMEPAKFDPMIASMDPLIRQMGLAGKAVASKKDVAAVVTKLLTMEYAVANAWALGYATHHATPEDARLIYGQLINNPNVGSDRMKAQRLDEAMVAAQYLCEKDPAGALQMLPPLLNREGADKLYVQGLIVGLIRAVKGEPHKVAELMTRNLDDLNTNALRSLLLGKHEVKLTPAQLADLGLLVRGGGGLNDALRMQGGWVYLKQTNQTKAAIELAIKN